MSIANKWRPSHPPKSIETWTCYSLRRTDRVCRSSPRRDVRLMVNHRVCQNVHHPTLHDIRGSHRTPCATGHPEPPIHTYSSADKIRVASATRRHGRRRTEPVAKRGDRRTWVGAVCEATFQFPDPVFDFWLVLIQLRTSISRYSTPFSPIGRQGTGVMDTILGRMEKIRCMTYAR
jgi:hypothetical protein